MPKLMLSELHSAYFQSQLIHYNNLMEQAGEHRAEMLRLEGVAALEMTRCLTLIGKDMKLDYEIPLGCNVKKDGSQVSLAWPDIPTPSNDQGPPAPGDANSGKAQ